MALYSHVNIYYLHLFPLINCPSRKELVEVYKKKKKKKIEQEILERQNSVNHESKGARRSIKDQAQMMINLLVLCGPKISSQDYSMRFSQHFFFFFLSKPFTQL